MYERYHFLAHPVDGYRWRQNEICKPMKDSVTTEVYFLVNKYHKDSFLANVNYVTFAICYRNSVCRLSVCNIGAPYSAG